MSHPITLEFHALDLASLPKAKGKLVLFVDGQTPNTPAARALNKSTRGAIARVMGSDVYGALKIGDGIDITFPTGLAADVVQLILLPRKCTALQARRAGGLIAKSLGAQGGVVLGENHPQVAEIAFGLSLRAYEFGAHKTTKPTVFGPVTVAVTNPESVARAAKPYAALAGWVHFLAFDLFVGAWITRTARAEGISHWLVLPCLVLTFLFGPAGFLAFTLLRWAVTLRPAPFGKA